MQVVAIMNEDAIGCKNLCEVRLRSHTTDVVMISLRAEGSSQLLLYEPYRHPRTCLLIQVILSELDARYGNAVG